MSAQSFLDDLQSELKSRFESDRALLAFDDYLDEVKTYPERHLRDANRYLYDAVCSFGSSTVERPYGNFTRYHIFDAPFDHGIDAVSGQEEAQSQLVGLLDDFIREGRANRLILLHGPNGSAKTSMISCLQRGLEHYSQSDDGALYTFSWLFPHKKSEGGGIGFGQGRLSDQVSSFTDLSTNAIEARVSNELRDHPLLLLPKKARLSFLRDVFRRELTQIEEGQETLETEAHLEVDAQVDDLLEDQIEARLKSLPRYLTEGDLSPQSASVFEALLKSYQGDIREVFKHVQVERFTISRRYRRGATTVDPQLRADAQVRQVTADRSLNSLPRSLQHLNLFEPMGHLVEGNRGLIEYNDLLKRPVEAFKYLLSTTESGAVRLDHLTLYLDAVLIGSCNFETLQAFIEMPDFASFKGRIELIRVPYLRDVIYEQRVYEGVVKSLQKHTVVTPDTAEWLARWAVMTRLERPQPVHFSQHLRSVIESLSPHEKLELYAYQRPPEHLSLDERRALVQEISALYYEPFVGGIYEGWLGASPRELKGLLLSTGRARESSVAHSPEASSHFISPLTIFHDLQELCTEESVYPFLRRKVSGHFYQPKIFVHELRQIYLRRFKASLFSAFGLIEADNELSQLTEYVRQLRYYVRGEKVQNPHTGRSEDPNETLLREVERRLGIKQNTEAARDSIIQQIAKWSLENPEAPLDYQVIFEEELRTLRASYVREVEEVASVRQRELMTLLEGEIQLQDESQVRAEKALTYLKDQLGYHEQSILEVLHSLHLIED